MIAVAATAPAEDSPRTVEFPAHDIHFEIGALLGLIGFIEGLASRECSGNEQLPYIYSEDVWHTFHIIREKLELIDRLAMEDQP